MNNKLFFRSIVLLAIFFNALSSGFSQSNPEVFKVVEEMPRFANCDNADATKKEHDKCSKDKLVEYISDNLVYPEKAKKDGVEGMVVVQFIVEKDGSLSNVKAVRDIGAGCGQSAIDVLQKMNDDGHVWIAGKQRGKPVSVLYTLPVKFQL